MEALVITLLGNEYSQQKADECIASGARHGLVVEKYAAVDKQEAGRLMAYHNLKWTWANDNLEKMTCPNTGLTHFPYATSDLRAKIGCSMSHYMLWNYCVGLNEPIIILEHDAVFIRDFPKDIEFNGICQINDPAGATRRGNWWSQQMVNRGTVGVHEKTWVTSETERDIPDGLAGNSAYIIKPWAAKELINTFNKIGVWPNDATICKQLFPYLEEYYPFITEVNQTKSTTV